MKNTSKATSQITQWSLMAGGVMAIDIEDKIHITLPHEIITADTVDQNLLVKFLSPEENKLHSLTLSPWTAMHSLSERAEKAGLPVIQFAAAEINKAVDEHAKESTHRQTLIKQFEQAPAGDPASRISATGNRLFTAYHILTAVTFAAMVYFGHGQKHEAPARPKHAASLSHTAPVQPIPPR